MPADYSLYFFDSLPPLFFILILTVQSPVPPAPPFLGSHLQRVTEVASWMRIFVILGGADGAYRTSLPRRFERLEFLKPIVSQTPSRIGGTLDLVPQYRSPRDRFHLGMRFVHRSFLSAAFHQDPFRLRPRHSSLGACPSVFAASAPLLPFCSLPHPLL